MEDPSPLDEVITFTDKSYLDKGEKIMRNNGYWQKNSTCLSVSYHEMKHDRKRKWYEIHCQNENKGNYFVAISELEWKYAV